MLGMHNLHYNCIQAMSAKVHKDSGIIICCQPHLIPKSVYWWGHQVKCFGKSQLQILCSLLSLITYCHFIFLLKQSFFVFEFFKQVTLGFPDSSVGKESPAMWATWVQPMGWEGPFLLSLEKGKATHSSILAWRILWTISPGGGKESDTTEHLSLSSN